MKRNLFALIGVVGLAGAANAQVWNEIIDAPFRPHPTGQITVGVGPLLQIDGLGNFGPDATGAIVFDADLYCVHIDGQFSATTVGGANWDTMLAIYDANSVTQLFFNDDSVGLQSTIGGFLAPGDYILAITPFPNGAFDGPGNGTTPYSIFLTGMSYCAVPTPATAALLGLGGLVALRRRR